MNDLNINYDETIKLGLEIINKGDELNEILLKVQSIINELQLVWQGQGANEFFNMIEEDTEQMKLFAYSINEIGLLLQETATSYQNIKF